MRTALAVQDNLLAPNVIMDGEETIVIFRGRLHKPISTRIRIRITPKMGFIGQSKLKTRGLLAPARSNLQKTVVLQIATNKAKELLKQVRALVVHPRKVHLHQERLKAKFLPKLLQSLHSQALVQQIFNKKCSKCVEPIKRAMIADHPRAPILCSLH